MRTATIAILLGIGALLAFTANASVWANRTIFSTDRFVETATDVYSTEEVQVALATRITDRIVAEGDVEGHIREALPDGMRFLAVPLTQAAHDVIHRTALRVVQTETAAEAFEAGLRVAHRQLIAILEDRSAVAVQEDSIVLNVGSILVMVLNDMGINDPGGFLAGLNLPPGAGTIVIVEDAGTARTVHQLARLHNTVTLSAVLASIAFFAAAVVLSTRRRNTARTIAILMLAVGLLSLVALVPIRGFVAGFTADEAVAREVFGVLVAGYRVQSLLLIAGAAVALGALFLVGDSALATSARQAARSRSGAGLQGSIRQVEPWLRAAGFVVAALALVASPASSLRLYITTLAFLIIYLAGLKLIASDTGRAVQVRQQIVHGWRRVTGPARPDGDWIARNSARLRVVGIVFAALFLVFWPSLTWGGAAALVAVTLIYLAAVDYFAGRSASPLPVTDTTPDPDRPVLP